MMDADAAGLLIAETGDEGEISWVWVMRGDAAMPRPLDLSEDGALELGGYAVAGAPRSAVLAWVDERLALA